MADRAAPWLLLLLAAALRLPRLGLRPLHHDEGTNVIFLLRLLREGTYQYDPSNYHGPLLYFLSAVPVSLFGETEFALRLSPALFGSLMAPACWLLRREIGRAGAAAAGILLALSPALVYYSRDNIHEIYLVSLTLLVVAASVRGLSGRPAFLALAGAAAGGMASTKETAFLTFAALAAALLLSRGAGLPRPRARDAWLFLSAATLVAVTLYTDLFSDPGGLLRPFQAVTIWGVRAWRADGHGKPWWYFLAILARDEPALSGLGLAGAAAAVGARDRFGLFLSGWALATLGAYSGLPYKTPWLVLNMVLPLGLLGGSALGRALGAARAPGGDRRGSARRAGAALLLVAAAALSSRRAYDLSFVRYDDDRASALVYVQTKREALDLVRRIQDVARRDPRGRSVPIEILSPDYLPLNWYLRDFSDVSYYGEVVARPAAPVVIARLDACDRVAGLLGPGYARETYTLRPGVDLCLFLEQAGPGADGPGGRL